MVGLGPDGAIRELPKPWRGVAYAGLVGVVLTVSYFSFVQGPIADAQDVTKQNSGKITTLQQDVSGIKDDINSVKTNQVRTDQKLDDMKDSVDAMNQKLDRLLAQGKRNGQFP